MSNVDRRTFLALLGVPAVAAALPQSLDKALAIPAHSRSGTIDDVEHVVFLMQENRSFDHYFGPMCATWARPSCRTCRTAGTTGTPCGMPDSSISGCPTRACRP